MSNKQAPITAGVTTELLATVDLGPEIEGLAGRQLRMRKVTIEPGGVFGPIHDHRDRPGLVYVLQGSITDHRNGISTPYGPGVGWPEDRKTVHWLENTGVSTWVRESPSIWAFPAILLFHTIGMALCVGVSAGINLRILGFAPGLRLAPMERFFPILWLGFYVNAITGTILVMQDATSKLRNVDFYVKMVFIALALINLKMIRTRVFRDPQLDRGPLATNVKVLAVASLFFWLGAITAGRLLAYVGPVSGLG